VSVSAARAKQTPAVSGRHLALKLTQQSLHNRQSTPTPHLLTPTKVSRVQYTHSSHWQEFTTTQASWCRPKYSQWLKYYSV